MKYHPEDTHWFICAILKDGTLHQELRLPLAEAQQKYTAIKMGNSAKRLGLGKKLHKQTWMLIDAEISRWAGNQFSARKTA